MRPGFPAVLLFVVVAAGSVYADVRVRLVAAPGASRCLSDLTVVARALDGETETRAVLPENAGAVVLPLKANDRVSTRAIAPGCWSETVERFANEADLVIKVYRAAKARGAFEAAARDQWPARLEAAVFPAPGVGERAISATESGHPLDCRFDKPNWECVVPADAPLDLRLSAKGFAPVYYWDVVARDEVTLEPRALHAGGSVSGWVEAPTGKPIENAQIVLAPAGHARNEDARLAAREAKTRTNRRGFFQLTGLAEGEYRLVSRANGFSPVLLPIVNLAEGESLVWPRTIVHAPFAELEVTLDPPADAAGKPWFVSAEAVIALETPPSRLRSAAGTDGKWQARTLRADPYRINIEDGDGAVLETFVVDLSKSGTTRIPVTVSRKVVRGVLRLGDDPIEAEIRFAARAGRSVRTKTDDLGRFKVSFPVAGKWTPTVFPGGPDGPRITAEEIVVPDTGEDQTIDVVLPGGRIRGSVVGRGGDKVKAAVHVSRGQTLVAQQVTDSDGAFDFIGIKEGQYSVDAEGDAGSARNENALVGDGESIELTLHLEPYRHVAVLVVTPGQAPASGAVVRISTDGGLSWSDLFTAVDGRFDYYLDDRDSALLAIILTHAYPALITRLTPSETPTILVLQSQGGMLRTTYQSFIGKAGALAPLKMFFVPPSRSGLYDGAAYLEPGVYAVCADPALSGSCRSVTVNPGADMTLDLQQNQEKGQ
jgi:hypothetical protein